MMYREIETCMNIRANGPTVVVVRNLPYDAAPWGGGVTYTENNVIHVTPLAIEQGWVLQHEYIHYLLAASGVAYEKNAAHDSPMFTRCLASYDAIVTRPWQPTSNSLR
jgi:hypothetical protein